ncbi:WXG100 family type VII secretion target [Nocardia callitridis]|uniref:WXG100 family type VII secretion target n=1 Tax=Nocardia callitridis TaxID=648753 RepID=A0ABP9KSF1_9NOCA
MSDLLYDPAAMTTLHDDLEHAGSQLTAEGQNLDGIANKFSQALIGDNANANFNVTYKNWSTEFSDTLDVLARLKNSVEEALHRALKADSAVGDGFNVM